MQNVPFQIMCGMPIDQFQRAIRKLFQKKRLQGKAGGSWKMVPKGPLRCAQNS